ncbi:MAG: hypothetical protein GVY16_10370 [Planctomycetes bacterium]|jgi:hypothetical protein|nr:hypothetical protein [Phycisphaerae bacterium]NBB96126.1 hypothetical protein [Planctomycetota bacterium]
MTEMKRMMIVGLIVLNGALLAGLIHLNMAPAQAQSFKSTDYVAAVGEISSDYDALFITDLASRRMVALKWDKNAQRMVAFGPHDLESDFGGR